MMVKGAATFFHQYLGDLFGVTAVYKLREALYKSSNTYRSDTMTMRKPET